MNAELIKTLRDLGFPRIQAQALDYFLSETRSPILSRDIEQGADLRMNQTHEVIRNFMDRGWLERSKAPADSTVLGKPPYLYTFKHTGDSLYKTIEADAHKQITTMEHKQITTMERLVKALEQK
jgi:predicted transcriptional regulator